MVGLAWSSPGVSELVSPLRKCSGFGSKNPNQNARLATRTADPIASIAHVSGESLERTARIRRVHELTSTVINRARYYGQQRRNRRPHPDLLQRKRATTLADWLGCD